MEALCSSETPVGFRQTTRRYNKGDKTSHRCENLKSSKEMKYFHIHFSPLSESKIAVRNTAKGHIPFSSR
jgi:hypothetical protein